MTFMHHRLGVIMLYGIGETLTNTFGIDTGAQNLLIQPYSIMNLISPNIAMRAPD